MASNTLLASSFLKSGTSLAGAVNQGQAQRAQAGYASTQAQVNENLAQMQVGAVQDNSDIQAQEKALQTKRMEGAQRASMAGQGVDAGSGSAAAVQKSTSMMGELDRLMISNNAAREAMGYKVQSIGYEGQSKMATIAAQQAQRSTILTGGMGALSAAAGGYGEFLKVDGGKPDSKTPSAPGYDSRDEESVDNQSSSYWGGP